MKKITAKLVKSEKGQAIVEFAIVLPIFLLIVFGIIDFGWLFYNQASVETAARNAARNACVNYMVVAVNDDGTPNTAAVVDLSLAKQVPESDRNDTQNLAIDMSTSLNASLSKVQMDVAYSTDKKANINNQPQTVIDRKNGNVTVTVSCDMKALTPVLGMFCENMTKRLTATSTFKVEQSISSTTAATTDH